MRAITIWQPWATLIMIGAKPYEFRGKSFREYPNAPQIRERIVIHAGARAIRLAEVLDLYAKCLNGGGATGLIVDKAIPLLERLISAYQCRGIIAEGAALGTAVIGSPRNAGGMFTAVPHDSDRGDFNWAWPLTDVVPFVPPIAGRGAQGFWHFNAPT